MICSGVFRNILNVGTNTLALTIDPRDKAGKASRLNGAGPLALLTCCVVKLAWSTWRRPEESPRVVVPSAHQRSGAPWWAGGKLA